MPFNQKKKGMWGGIGSKWGKVGDEWAKSYGLAGASVWAGGFCVI